MDELFAGGYVERPGKVHDVVKLHRLRALTHPYGGNSEDGGRENRDFVFLQLTSRYIRLADSKTAKGDFVLDIGPYIYI